MEARVDNLHAGVAQGAGDDLRAPVVSVKAWFCNNDTNLPRHDRQVYERAPQLPGPLLGDRAGLEAVKLTVVGCSPAWPNPGGAQSGYLIEGSGKLLLDCGPGVLARLRADNGWPHVDAIAITHFHLDHWGDLVPWVWGRMFGLGRDDARIEVWLPPEGIAELQAFGNRFGTSWMFEKSFELREYAEGETFEAAGYKLFPIRLPHYTLRTYGFRVTNGERTLAYSGDSGPSDELARLARGADLFICEATLERGELDGEPRGHLSADEAVESYKASGARRLLLTHRPHELALDDGLEQAYDGMELAI
jgi:ribonuclease BN (tRNA processing enzyme)